MDLRREVKDNTFTFFFKGPLKEDITFEAAGVGELDVIEVKYD